MTAAPKEFGHIEPTQRTTTTVRVTIGCPRPRCEWSRQLRDGANDRERRLVMRLYDLHERHEHGV